MTRFLLLISFFSMILSFQAVAEEHMDLPQQNFVTNKGQAASPILHLMQDKSEMIQLREDAASVIVGNPNHINVILDTPTTLIVVPRGSGASHFSVIGKDGTVILERQVVVGAPHNNNEDGNKYVRIRRSCAASTSRNCQPSSVYFCNGSCHEVSQNAETKNRSTFSFF